MRKQLKWWMIPVTILLMVFIGSALLWPTLKIYLAPKTVLSAALTDTYDALKQRMQNSPIRLLCSSVDMENGNTVAMELNTTNDLLGTVQYDMAVQTKWNPRQIYAQGTVTAQEKTMDLSMYLDDRFAALSSAGLLDGNFYGLTYDTFSQDIRANRLISLVVGEHVLSEWETGVNSLQTFMSQTPMLPELSDDDFRSIVMGILALKAEVDRERIDVNGVQEECFVISFETTGSEIMAGLDYLKLDFPIPLDPDDDVDVAFWLQDDTVTKIEMEAGDREVELYSGMSHASGVSDDDLILYYEADGEVRSIRVSTQQDASTYQETITITGAEALQLSYTWNLSSGELTLRKGEGDAVSLNLSATENGFRMETEDFGALMHLLFDAEDSSDSPCAMTVTKGAEIAAPEYKNFSDWSLEDLITLIGGIGGLFGLKIG